MLINPCSGVELNEWLHKADHYNILMSVREALYGKGVPHTLWKGSIFKCTRVGEVEGLEITKHKSVSRRSGMKWPPMYIYDMWP